MDSPIHKTWNSIKSKPKILSYIFLLDVAFLALLYLVNLSFEKFIPTNSAFMTQTQTNTLALSGILILFVIYFGIIISIYSFFSLLVMGNIKKMSVDHDHDFSLLKKMLLLNVVLFVLFFLIAVILNIALTLLQNQSVWLGVFVGIILVIIAFIAYGFYSLTHSALILKHEVKDIFKKSLKSVFTKSFIHSTTLTFVVMALYIGSYLVMGLVFKNNITNNLSLFVNILSIVWIILIYLLFTFNRIHFFFIAEKHIGHKK